jgi:hypothetical protein
MDTRLATSFFVGRHRCYGYDLLPFCLLHSLQLEALDNPLVTAHRDPTPAEIIIAAQICSTHEIVTEPRVPLWRQLCFNPDREEDRFENYVKNCTAGPQLWKREKVSAGTLRAPWQQIVVTYLIRNTTITWRQAWTMTEGVALWQFYSLREQLEDESEILDEKSEIAMDEALRDAEKNAPDLADQAQALVEREERIKAGTWPLAPNGVPLPYDPANRRPAIPVPVEAPDLDDVVDDVD